MPENVRLKENDIPSPYRAILMQKLDELIPRRLAGAVAMLDTAEANGAWELRLEARALIYAACGTPFGQTGEGIRLWWRHGAWTTRN